MHPCFAPIRRLDTLVLAAVDVQLRGAAGGPFDTAAALQDAARAMSQKVELDRLKWVAAKSSDLTGFPALVTIDLESVEGIADVDTEALTHSVLVIADSTLISRPGATLEAVRQARAAGKLVAVDGIGGSPRALALLPLIEPDIVILDPALIAHRPDAATARTVHAVAAQVERTNAVVVASGVDADTPYSLLSTHRRSIRSRKRLLITMSTTLEAQAAASGPETVVLGTFQHARHFTTRTASRWRNLAESVAYVGVYGVDMLDGVDAGIHHAPLSDDDELVEEWTIVVLAPHFCSVLSARDLHRGEDDMDREFDYVVSYDRAAAVRSARSIMRRFTA